MSLGERTKTTWQDQSDPGGKTLVTAPAREMLGAESGRLGPEINRSPQTTGYVSIPAAAMSVMRIPRSRVWVPQFAGIVPKPASTRLLAGRRDDWIAPCAEPATPLK